MMFKWLTDNRKTRQYMAGISCCLAMSMLSCSISWTSPAIPKLLRERPYLHLTNHEISWMVSSLYLGILVSPIPSGYLMDRLGRKKTLLYATSFTLISWPILYFATAPYQFNIARFLCGLTNGVVYTITPIYVTEIADPDVRGSVGNMIAILVNLSAVYVYAVGSITNFGSLIIATSAVPVLFLLTFSLVPESPYHYVIQDNQTKAIKSLMWFRCDRTKDEIINELRVIDTYVQDQMKNKSRFKDLVISKSNRKGLVIAIALTIIQRFTGSGALMAFSSVTIPENSFSFLTVNQCAMILGIMWLITPIISSFFVDRFARRMLLMISCFGCGLTLLFPALWFYFDEKTTGFEATVRIFIWVPFVSLLCHAWFFAIGIGSLGSSMRGELFPANMKGKASAVTTICLATMSFIINKCYLILADSYGMFLNFAIFSIICFLSTIFIYVYVIETKGKTLEEIQDKLNGIKSNELMTTKL